MVGEQFTKDYQDIREIRANRLIKHYSKEQDFDLKFNEGIMDAAAYGEEIYQCDIVGGEPVLEKLDPLKVRVLRSGFSNKIEDADMIIIEDYWSPGRIIDTYFDSKDLKESDIKKIEETALSFGGAATDSMDNIDPRVGLLDADILGVDPPGNEGLFWDPIMEGSTISSLAPYDFYGNIKVLRVFWKSRRKIKKVTRIDQDTRQKVSEFYPETYQISEELGETEEFYYVNQAWEGTKIGKDIYLNMRPRPIQYNRLNNPSRCHFGIIGSIYNLYNNKPFSLVDMMKPYNYMYDVFHDRLNKLMARSWGTLMRVDLAKMPRQWDMEKWFYYAKSMGIAVEDSFAEGQYGAALGKVAGAMNTASSGVVAASDVNTMQQYIMYLDYIKKAMSEVVGITP